jgi:hypothetical protein
MFANPSARNYPISPPVRHSMQTQAILSHADAHVALDAMLAEIERRGILK